MTDDAVEELQPKVQSTDTVAPHRSAAHPTPSPAHAKSGNVVNSVEPNRRFTLHRAVHCHMPHDLPLAFPS